jgi:hypothetical protein
MRVADPAEIQASAVRSLGLDPDVCDLTSPESMAAALRRAAGFLCPCPRRTLIDATLASFSGLIPGSGQLEEQVENVLEAVIAHGDLLEAGEVVASQGQYSRAAILYAAPPRMLHHRASSGAEVERHCSWGLRRITARRSPLYSKLVSTTRITCADFRRRQARISALRSRAIG